MFVETQLILLLFFALLTSNISQNRLIKTFTSVILVFFFIIECLSYYIQGELIDYRFFIHSDISIIKTYLFQFKYEFIFIILIYLILIYFIVKINFKKFIKKIIYIPLFFLVFLSITLPNKSAIYKLYEVNKIYNGSLIYDVKSKTNNEENYKNFIIKNNLDKYRKNIELFEIPDKNIILITLESIDDGFIFNTPELTPNLNKIIKKWHFKKIKNIDGCSWSVGSLYCLMTGLPAYFPFEKNKIFQNTSKINLNTLSKVFKKSNYSNIEYFVGESNFVGTGDLLKSIGFDVKDHSKITGKYKIYPNTFGYHDKDLFYELKQNLRKLNNEKKSFVTFATTINTHLNGIRDERMTPIIGDNYKNDVEHAVKSLDYLVGDFIDFLENEGILKNTSVFIIPDHFFPKNKSLKQINDKINKTERSLYIISNNDIISHKDPSQLDIANIILDSVGIKSNVEFFNQNNSISNINKFINENLNFFSKFNNENIIYNKPLEKIVISIRGDNLIIKSDENEVFNLNLNNNISSYINLLFDENFNFINDEYKKETSTPRKIRKEDEVFNYNILTIFKKNNIMMSGKIVNAKDKTSYNLKINNNNININIPNISKKNNIQIYSTDTERFIAHAGGGVNGVKYLNSVEALNHNYNLGFKMFELDLQLTKDGYIVATHDWNKWKKNTNYKGEIPPLLSEFNNASYKNGLQVLDYMKINNWFKENKDATLIIDKLRSLEKIEDQINIDKSKILIEVFNSKDLKKFRNKDYNVIANIGFLNEIENPITYLKENNVSFIAASHKIKEKYKNNIFNIFHNLFGKNIEKQLIENNFKIFAYNLNEKKDTVNELDIICKYRDVFYGMYADFWNFTKAKVVCLN